jgi:hypothetical protein
LRNYYKSKRQLLKLAFIICQTRKCQLLKLALKADEKRQRLGDAKQALILLTN